MPTDAPRRSPLGITWTANERVAMALVLLGCTSKYIATRTLLTEGQINYRARKLLLQGERAKFHNVETVLAQAMVARGLRSAQPMISRRILETPGGKHVPLRADQNRKKVRK